MRRESDFETGDRAIRTNLEELATRHNVSHEGVTLVSTRPGIYLYSLQGTDKSIALREREILYASAQETRARYVTPRLQAMFKELWWEQALVLMGLRTEGKDPKPSNTKKEADE